MSKATRILGHWKMTCPSDPRWNGDGMMRCWRDIHELDQRFVAMCRSFGKRPKVVAWNDFKSVLVPDQSVPGIPPEDLRYEFVKA